MNPLLELLERIVNRFKSCFKPETVEEKKEKEAEGW